MQSSLLRSLVTPGEGFPDPTGPLQKLLAAADWDAAADEGRIRPCRVSLSSSHAVSRPGAASQVLECGARSAALMAGCQSTLNHVLWSQCFCSALPTLAVLLSILWTGCTSHRIYLHKSAQSCHLLTWQAHVCMNVRVPLHKTAMSRAAISQTKHQKPDTGQHQPPHCQHRGASKAVDVTLAAQSEAYLSRMAKQHHADTAGDNDTDSKLLTRAPARQWTRQRMQSQQQTVSCRSTWPGWLGSWEAKARSPTWPCTRTAMCWKCPRCALQVLWVVA